MSPQRRVTKAQQRSAALKVFRAQHALEDAAIAEQLRLLGEMRRLTLAALGEASGFRVFHLGQVLAAIDREIERGGAAAQQLASRSTTRAYRLGAELVDGAVFSVGPTAGGLADVSPALLSALLDVTNDQLRSVWSELGTSLKATVRRTALGITDPFAAMGEIARTIRNPKVFGTPMNRAEVIVRTEVNRTFSIATQSRLEQSDARLGGSLGKWWLAVDDHRTRPDHAEAGQRYGPNNPIPVDEAFIVGGERLMYPLDPSGSAENTINCRCRSVPSVTNVRLPAPIKLAS